MRMVARIRRKNRFRLEPGFLREFAGKQPAWGPCGHFTFTRTYAQKVGDTDRLEEFWECLQRVTEGTYSYLKQAIRATGQRWDDHRAQRDAQRMFRQMWAFKWLPPGRGLQYMGTRALEIKGSAILQNCGFVSTKDIDQHGARPFVMAMDFLMLGVGMGFDTRGAGTLSIGRPTTGTHRHVVADTREGWVDAVETVLHAYLTGGVLPAAFDYSQIRPKDAPLKTLGGKSSGPQPLEDLLDGLITYLGARIGETVSGRDIVDVMNRIGCCVVAGNIRRSAEIALGDVHDAAFAKIKDRTEIDALQACLATLEPGSEAHAATLALIKAHPMTTHLWASNNSVICDSRDPTIDYEALARQTITNGEPGYLWLDVVRAYGRRGDAPDDADALAMGCNPCGEQPLFDNELCCLVETFPTNHATAEEFEATLKMAFLYGKVVTTIPTHRAETNAVINRNRRIGLSMAGVFGYVEKHGLHRARADWDRWYRYVKKLDREYSGWMGVPRSIKVTSVKPGGTVPLLAGIEGGMRAPQAPYYFRTIRVQETSPLVAACARAGYRIEDDLNSKLTKVIYFPVAERGFTRTAAEVSLWEQAAIFTALQEHWSDNMVSATLMFQPHEADDVGAVLKAHVGRWKGVSFLALDQHGYAQAPYQAITSEEYAEAVAHLQPLDLGAAQHEVNDGYCSGLLCERPGSAA